MQLSTRATGSDFKRKPICSYQGSVVQIGGIGSRLVTKTAWLISEHGYLRAEEFVTHWFNSAGDLLWVSCPEEYLIVGATSPTGNEIYPMRGEGPDTPCGILLKDQLKNTIVIKCERMPELEPLGRATGAACPKCSAPMGPYERYCTTCGFEWPEAQV